MRATLRWLLNLKPRVQRFPSERFTLKNECDPREITLFVDASWSLDSTSGGIISWMNCCLKAFSRKQPTTALSSAEAELMALTEGTKESIYIGLLVEHLTEGVEGEVGTYPIDALCDSQAAICISNMNSLLRKVRHLELRAQYIQEQVSSGRLKPSYLPGKENPSDGLTKSPTEEMLWSLYEATGLVEYFGVTKSVDFLSYNCLGCLVELFKCLAEGSSVKVWCHISTPCTAGCGLRHLHMKNESFLPKWREQIAQHIQGWNRIARLFARHCDNPRLLLTQEWPERTDLWYEENYRRAARQLKLTRSGCRVERCCFDGVLKTWYFVSNQPLFVQEMHQYQKCSNDHEHRRVEVKDSGFYPAEMGRVLLTAARRVLKKSLQLG